MRRFDVQLEKNLAEHLNGLQISTHYQGRKRHTSRMLGFGGKLRQVTSVIGAPNFGCAKKALKMSSQMGNGLIALGALGAVIGLIMLPAALGEHPDTSLLIL